MKAAGNIQVYDNRCESFFFYQYQNFGGKTRRTQLNIVKFHLNDKISSRGGHEPINQARANWNEVKVHGHPYHTSLLLTDFVAPSIFQLCASRPKNREHKPEEKWIRSPLCYSCMVKLRSKRLVGLWVLTWFMTLLYAPFHLIFESFNNIIFWFLICFLYFCRYLIK